MSRLILMATAVVLFAADAPADVRRAIERSLPFLESDGLEWMEKRECNSCHQIPFMLWSFAAARSSGLDVDTDQLDAWRTWSSAKLLEKRENEDILVGERNTEGLAWLILSDNVRDDATKNRFREIIVSTQTPDGSWKPQGQLPGQRTSDTEARAVSTTLSVLALGGATNSPPARASAREKGLAWLKANAGGDDARQSTDAMVLRILLALEQRSERAGELVAELLARQNDDGGWGYLKGDPSDAYGTGESLYVLRLAASSGPTDVRRTRGIARAVEYLLRSQESDGTWSVPSTLERKKRRVLPTSKYWGTAWAVIGLAGDLDGRPARTRRF